MTSADGKGKGEPARSAERLVGEPELAELHPRTDDRELAAQRRITDALGRILGEPTEVEQRFRTILDQTFQFIWLLAPDGSVLDANRSALDFAGATRAETIGNRFADTKWWAASADARQRLESTIATAATGTFVRHELALPNGNGEQVTLDFSLKPLLDRSGRVALLVLEARDITQRKRVEEALRISEAKFGGIVAIAADAIVTVDEAQRITLFNTGAERIFGYRADEVIGEPLDLLIPERNREAHRRHMVDFAKGPVVARRMGERREIFGRRKSGEMFPAEASISKIEIDGKRLFTAVLRDVTARKEAEDETRRLLGAEEAARQAAEVATRLRDEVLSVVSHDLRNPLSVISMCATTLLGGSPEDGAPLSGDSSQAATNPRELGGMIKESAEWMQRLIGDLLDVASIEGGRLSLDVRPIDPVILVVQAVSMLEPLAAERSITLVAELPEHLPRIKADPDRLMQVLSNLVGNAVKFTAGGGRIVVRAAVGAGVVRFEVSDSGQGIPPAHLSRVFDRFWHAQREGKSSVRGTGLGLAIAKGIVEAHGGVIGVESRVAVGSTFSFTVPMV